MQCASSSHNTYKLSKSLIHVFHECLFIVILLGLHFLSLMLFDHLKSFNDILG